MAATPTVLGMPQEILVMILREHFLATDIQTRPINSDPSKRQKRRNSTFLSILLTNKALNQSAYPLLTEHATLHHKGKYLDPCISAFFGSILSIPERFKHLAIDPAFASTLVLHWKKGGKQFPNVTQLDLTAKNVTGPSGSNNRFMYEYVTHDLATQVKFFHERAIHIRCYCTFIASPPATADVKRARRQHIMIVIQGNSKVELRELILVHDEFLRRVMKVVNKEFGSNIRKPTSCSGERYSFRNNEVEWRGE